MEISSRTSPSSMTYTLQESKTTISSHHSAKPKDVLRLLGSGMTQPYQPVASTSALTYPNNTPRAYVESLQILNTPEKGRGVFASTDLPKGTLLDIAPVLVVPPDQYSRRDGVGESVLKDYVFVWDRVGSMAVALGLGSMFNHAKFPNVSFKIDRASHTIHYTLCKNVQAGDELCIYYGPHAKYGESEDSEEDETLDGWQALTAVEIDDGESQDPANEKEAKALAQMIADELEDPQEILLFKDLPCQRVTDDICLADLPLEMMQAWVVDIESKNAPVIFELLRKGPQPPPSSIQHLKRIKRLTQSRMSVIVYPLVPAIPDSLLQQLLSHPFVTSPPYLTHVPTRPAVTREQIVEFASVWPTIFVPVRVGRTAEILSKGWRREHLNWVRTMIQRVERLASEARSKNGELPIASLVASSVLGPPLAEAVDERISTGNLLCHSVSRVIDAVAAIDRVNGRVIPGQAPPYLLSGLSLFTTHEPCLMCSMSLLHSRIAVVYYVRQSLHAGGLGSVYKVHEDKGLNHKFEAWQWLGEQGSTIDDKQVNVDP